MAGGSQKLWEDVSPGRFAEAQKFADQGQWNQASQQYQLGGGQFGQPQMQAFTQQYGNMFPQSQPTGPTQWAGPDAHYPNWNDDPSSGYANDVAILPPLPVPPAQAQPAAPPGAIAQPTAPSYQPPPQMLPPTPTAPQMPKPGGGPPGTRAITSPNWASYVQGNPDLLSAYNKGSPQSIGDWGKSHWESFGQNESRAVNPYRGLLG